MPRRIISEQLHSAGAQGEADGYADRLIKNIPADIIAAWTAASGLIASASDIPRDTVLWVAFGVGVILTTAWTLRQTTMEGMRPAITQTIIATGSFVVWVFALGGPFVSLPFYRPAYGSLLLILYTVLVPLIIPPEGKSGTVLKKA